MKNMLFILLFVFLSSCQADSYEPNILKFDIRVNSENGLRAESGELFIVKAHDHNPLAKDEKGKELMNFGSHEEPKPISLNDVFADKDFYVPVTPNRAYLIYTKYFDYKDQRVWINSTSFVYKEGIKTVKINVKF